MIQSVKQGALLGAGLVVLYTGLISGADGITKFIADDYAAPQLYALSGFLVILMSCLADRHPNQRKGLATRQPVAMAIRSGATVIASISFFYAFRSLPFADVFVFIGMMPILAGFMSQLILKETVQPAAWLALLAGFVGVLCLFPGGISAVGAGHLWAMAAAVFGTLSMVLARFIGRYESNTLAQVFYPNLALCLTMACALPFVWVPIPLGDLALCAAYAVLLFGARWLLVISLRMLAAYAVTPLMNLQFVWMVIIGAVAFGELPTSNTLLGVSIVIGSGLYLVWEQFAPRRTGIALNLRTDP